MTSDKIVDLNIIAEEYINVINSFKKLPDVQNAKLISYHDNQDPNDILRDKNWASAYGTAITTTGFCVSVSRAFLEWKGFQTLLNSRNAKAKLVSIDIKEQYWGVCYNGDNNSFHTAILVQDSSQLFIIDLTCSQFGNRFVGKDIWNFTTWEKTFRSPLCKHVITDFNDNVLLYNNTAPNTNNNLYYNKYQVHIDDEMLGESLSKTGLFDGTEIDILKDFFSIGMYKANVELYYGCLNEYPTTRLNHINSLLSRFRDIYSNNVLYSVLEFVNYDAAKLYLQKLSQTKDETTSKSTELGTSYKLFNYLPLFDNMESAVSSITSISYTNVHSTVNLSNINSQDTSDDALSYIVFEFRSMNVCIDTSGIMGYYLLPFGMTIPIQKKNVFNGVKLLNHTSLDMNKTNTIYVIV